jgi:hypothetical protein
MKVSPRDLGGVMSIHLSGGAQNNHKNSKYILVDELS